MVCNYLKKHGVPGLDGTDLEIHDIDEEGVPKFGRGHWRKYRIDELLGNARKVIAKKSSIVCGSIFPHEVIDSKLFERRIKVYFILLDASPQTISRRLAKRKQKESKKRRKALIDANIKNSRKLRNQAVMQKKGFIVDTRNKSIKQVLDEVLSIIKKAQKRRN